MVSFKLIIFLAIVTILFNTEGVVAKKQRRNIKAPKKPNQNGKLKPSLKQSTPISKTNQRNGKMNFYNSHLWPTTSTYYRPATSSNLYLRSPSTTQSMFYPMHWGNSFINALPFMPTSTMRRSDQEYASSSSPTSASTMGSSQIPTLYDMSAFTGNAGLVEHPFTGANQNLWSLGGDTVTPPTAKPKFNLFNSFNYNDDGGIFGGFLNHFI